MCYNGNVEECAEAFQGTFANAGVPGSTNNDNKRLLYRYSLARSPGLHRGSLFYASNFNGAGQIITFGRYLRNYTFDNKNVSETISERL